MVFLGARDRQIKVMIPACNMDQSTMTFAIGPKATEYAYRRIEDAGMEVVAIFHSHTESSPVPSIADVVQANRSIASVDPDFRWIIIGPGDADKPLVHAYHIGRNDYTETRLEIL